MVDKNELFHDKIGDDDEIFHRVPPIKKGGPPHYAVEVPTGRGLSNIELKYKKLDKKAKEPTKATLGAAAYDLCALGDIELAPFNVTMVRTGLAFEIPKGYKGEIYSRSGLAKEGIFVANQPGKIDSDYRGEALVALLYIPGNTVNAIFNLYKALFQFTKGFQSTNQMMIDRSMDSLRAWVKNSPFSSYKISAGDRVAQFEIQKTEEVDFVLSKKLSETKRDTGGFGSTGK